MWQINEISLRDLLASDDAVVRRPLCINGGVGHLAKKVSKGGGGLASLLALRTTTEWPSRDCKTNTTVQCLDYCPGFWSWLDGAPCYHTRNACDSIMCTMHALLVVWHVNMRSATGK
mmetsp:Transcript_9431/g.15137  ORF Transcript_9431/g.15137 Transcript_9431/m.15137 type:complete len:117 (+) Transcript_9431:883-1233(+)